ncbi:MAG: ribosome silencing factor [Gammaproteobacteria bacterium]|nr:ribosome silencing factor [Gammaproteobacteria bacterium]
MQAPQGEALKDLIVDALEELKGVDIQALDVRGKTTITDFMVVVSGRSDRHVKSLADNVIKRAKAAGVRPLGVEGEREAQWILLDLGDAVVHVMLPRMREFYHLEKLWRFEESPESLRPSEHPG